MVKQVQQEYGQVRYINKGWEGVNELPSIQYNKQKMMNFSLLTCPDHVHALEQAWQQ
jgi:hypothetical protein